MYETPSVYETETRAMPALGIRRRRPGPLRWRSSERSQSWRLAVAIVGFCVLLGIEAIGEGALAVPLLSGIVIGLALIAVVRGGAAWAIACAALSLTASIAFGITGWRPGPSYAEALALILLLGTELLGTELLGTQLPRVRPRRPSSTPGRIAGPLIVVPLVVAAVIAQSLRVAHRGYAGIVVVAVAAVAIGIVVLVRRQAQRRASLIASVRLDEREKISRELHDVVASQIEGVVVAAQAAQYADGGDRRTLGLIEEAGREALAAVRHLVTALRDEDPSRQTTLCATLTDTADLVERFRALGVAERVISELPPRLSDRAIETIVHRIVHESLRNTMRYATGSALVSVRVTESAKSTSVMVENSGGRSLPDPYDKPRSHVGILGMRERVASLGGSFEAGPSGAGWRVVAVIPR